jgi:V8-like Glu-specific endopeptidase
MIIRCFVVSGVVLVSLTVFATAQTAPPSSVSASPVQKGEQKPAYATAKPFALPIAEGYTDEKAQKALAGVASASEPTGVFEKGALGSGNRDTKPLRTPVSKEGENLPSAGKLFFKVGGDTYICSASLIKPGVVVTAAHCVAQFGTNTYHSDWEFHPGYRNGTSPFGAWTVERAFVLTSYLDGSDPCTVKGIVCQNDIAVLVLKPQRNRFVGKRTGYFAYAFDRGGFTRQRITHVTQIGYPACLDNAGLMERNDAQGAADSTQSDNTVIGSLMCGGSSGGPWLINFGLQPALTGTQFGVAPTPNAVIGVTSWGSTNNAVKWMGASPFLTSNIKKLVDAACNAFPAACN